MHMHVYVYTIYLFMQTYMHMCVYIHICMCVCVCTAYVHIYMYMYMYMYMYTYTFYMGKCKYGAIDGGNHVFDHLTSILMASPCWEGLPSRVKKPHMHGGSSITSQPCLQGMHTSCSLNNYQVGCRNPDSYSMLHHIILYHMISCCSISCILSYFHSQRVQLQCHSGMRSQKRYHMWF